MRKIILFAMLLFPAIVRAQCAGGGTCTLADGQSATVSAALASINTEGTTVVIPAGSWTWSSTVTYNQSFSTVIQGQGNTTGSDSLGNPTGYNDQTIIFDLVGNSNNQTFVINTAANKTFRMTGVSFLFTASQTTTRNQGIIGVGGHSHSVRIDHNHLQGGICCRGINFGTADVWGVMDHNYLNITNGINVNLIEVNGPNWNGTSDSHGDASWNDFDYFGTVKFMFIENNTLAASNGGANGTTANIDIQEGARFVLRYNTLSNVALQTHGIGHDGPIFRDRGPRAWEVYNNSFSSGQNGYNTYSFVSDYEGGTGLYHDNKITKWTNFIRPDYRRSSGDTYAQNQPPNGWGYCGSPQTGPNGTGPSVWDQNLDSSGQGCIDGVGRGKGDLLSGNTFPGVTDNSLAWGKMDMWLQMNTSTPGTTLTPTILANGTISGTVFTWQTCVGSGTCSNTTSSSYTVGASQGTIGGAIVVNGTAYPDGTTTQALALAPGTSFVFAETFSNPGGHQQVVANGYYTAGTSVTNNMDLVGLWGANGDWAVMQAQSSGGVAIETGSPTQRSATIALIAGHRYAFSLLYDEVNGLGKLAIFDPSNNYAQVGVTQTATMPTGNVLGHISIGNSETGSSSSTIYLEDFMVDWTNHVFPNKPTLVGIQTWPNQARTPAYMWANTLSTVTNYLNIADAATANNRDIFIELPNVNNAATFNGTAGIGSGTLTPTTAGAYTNAPNCSSATYPGPGYWDTATNTLYVCTAANTWTAYYTPFTYPHPLVSGATCTQPIISNVVATPDSTGTQATLTWTTSVAADSLVGFGIGSATQLTAITDTSGVTSHSIPLTNLLPNTIYAYGIRSRAIVGGAPCGPAFYGFVDVTQRFTTAAPPAGTADYYIVPDISPKFVTQGFEVALGLRVGILVGTIPNLTVSVTVTGLPNFVSLTWTDQQTLGSAGVVSTTTVANDTLKWYQLANSELRILTNQGGTTTPGAYTLTFTTSGAGVPTHTTTMPLTVDSASSPFGIAFPFGTPSSYPAIPDLATYKSTATTYGPIHCAQDLDVSPRTIRPNDNSNLTPVGQAIQKGSWYYDGVRVYWNVQNLTQDGNNYEQCRVNIRAVYRDGYIIPNSGAVQVFTMFPEGPYMDVVRQADTTSLNELNLMDAHTYAPGNAVQVSVNRLQREVAYSLKDDIFANVLGQNNPRFGQSTSFWLGFHLEHLLGHIDEICRSQNAGYWQTFMTGLEADALIDYYNNIAQDSRIPSAIKCLADYIFANAWQPVSDDPGAFQYDTWRGATNMGVANAGASSMVPLNLLVAPMYAWLFSKTGLAQYQTSGDLVWDHGVLLDGAAGGITAQLNQAYPGGNSGKLFSQQYYWGPSYVIWRSFPISGTPIFSPVAGAYSVTQTVAITSSTFGAIICETNDGSTPTANGSGVCTHGNTLSNGGTVTVPMTQTLKAIASESGFSDSSVGTAIYTIAIGPATNLSVKVLN